MAIRVFRQPIFSLTHINMAETITDYVEIVDGSSNVIARIDATTGLMTLGGNGHKPGNRKN